MDKFSIAFCARYASFIIIKFITKSPPPVEHMCYPRYTRYTCGDGNVRAAKPRSGGAGGEQVGVWRALRAKPRTSEVNMVTAELFSSIVTTSVTVIRIIDVCARTHIPYLFVVRWTVLISPRLRNSRGNHSRAKHGLVKRKFLTLRTTIPCRIVAHVTPCLFANFDNAWVYIRKGHIPTIGTTSWICRNPYRFTDFSIFSWDLPTPV